MMAKTDHLTDPENSVAVHEASIRWKGKAVSAKVGIRVSLSDGSFLRLHFSINCPRIDIIDQSLDRIEVLFDGASRPTACELIGYQLDPNPSTLSYHPNGGIWLGTEHPTAEVKVLIVNLGEYHHLQRDMVELTHGVLRWKLNALTNGNEEVQGLTCSDGYLLSHEAALSRIDGEPIPFAEVESQVEHLRMFLSFAHGRWVAPLRIEGWDGTDGPIYQQWRDPLTSRYRKYGNGWLDSFDAQALSKLWPLFMQRRKDQLWQETLDVCIYWMIRSDSETVGTDGGLILLQAALERLTWHYLVLEKKRLRKQDFRDAKKYPAASKICLMLDMMGIDPSIPISLPNLKSFTAESNGPRAITKIRNSLTHAEKPPSVVKTPISEAYFLTRHYLQLSLLKICGHSGNYINWTQLPRFVGEVAKVPWGGS